MPKEYKKKVIKCGNGEVFKPIPDYEKLYEISNYGRVKSIRKNIILKQKLQCSGFKSFILYNNDNKSKLFYTHITVAELFIDKPNANEKMMIKHINENIVDNNVDNLQWIHFIKKPINNNIYKKNKYGEKPVIKLNMKGDILDRYESIHNAALKNNASNSWTSICCNHDKIFKSKYRLRFCTKDDEIKIKNDSKLQHIKIIEEPQFEIKSDEIFKDIPGFEKIYAASNYGNIKSLASKRILKQHFGASGYKKVSLCNIKKKCSMPIFYVHRLISKTFLIKPESNKPLVVDHINGNKNDNTVPNLRWVTHSENAINAQKNNKNFENIKKPVYKLDLEGNIIHRYESIKDATLKNDFMSKTSIVRCCKNTKLSCKKTKWKYCDNKEEIFLHDDEIFKKIDYVYDYKFDKYEISNYGKIKNSKTGEYLKPCKNSGYYKLNLRTIDKKKVEVSIHRTVALFFIGREDKNKIVNHKDECKINNKWTNLEWLNNHRENTVYSTGKKIKQINKDTDEIINKFNCIKDAYRYLNKHIKSQGIQKCLRGEQTISYGFKWALA